MAITKERYTITKSVQAISAGASDFIGNTEADQAQRQKWGSANSLVITSLAGENIAVDLDGLTTRRVALLAGLGGSFVISPTDNIFFDFVKLTNLDGANATGNDEINVRMSRAEVIPER